MPEQIPRQIIELAERQHRELLSLERRQQAAVLARLENVLSVLKQEINGQDISSFRANEARVISILANVAQAQSYDQIDRVLREAIAEAYGLAPQHAVNEINSWIDYHGGEPRSINLSAVAELETETLIERYQASLATYGQAVANSVRAALSTGIVARQDRNEIVSAVQRAIGGERWRAARIVRTETINAYNASHNASLFEARDSGQVPDLKKSAIATFDARTNRDSFPVHGQVKDLEDDFVDGKGRRYLHPPGRPNDREKEIPWLDDLDPILIETPDEQDRIENERAEEQSRQQQDDAEYQSRVNKFARSWSRNSQSKEAIKLKRAASSAFDLPGKVYTRRKVTVDAAEQAQADADVRRMYEDTQNDLRAAGVTSVRLRRPVVDGEIIGTFEDWTDRQLSGEYIEQDIDARRILRQSDNGDRIVLSAIPRRRFEKQNFDVGFFNAHEIDPDAERSGPFGLLSDDGESTLYHLPTGRVLVSGRYSRDDLRRLAHDFEVAGYVDSTGALVGKTTRDEFNRNVERIVDVFNRNRREERRRRRGDLTFKKDDFEIGFFNASEFDPAAERSGVWGVLEYGATEDSPSGGALYHIPTGQEVLSGAFNKRDLKRLAQDIDQYIDDNGRLPDERDPDYGLFDDEIRSARMYFQRQRVDGFPGAIGARRYVNVGEVEFPAINDDVQKEAKGRYSRRVMKVVEEGVNGELVVSEHKGYLNGNFFYYKTASDYSSANNFDVNDWHIVHAKTGVHLHSGTAMPVSETGMQVGGWRLSKFKDVGERLERFLNEDGSVKEGLAEEWLKEIEQLQTLTTPDFSVRFFLGDNFEREDWITSPLSKRVRTRLVKSDLAVDSRELLDFLDNGPEIEQVEDTLLFDDVPF